MHGRYRDAHAVDAAEIDASCGCIAAWCPCVVATFTPQRAADSGRPGLYTRSAALQALQ